MQGISEKWSLTRVCCTRGLAVLANIYNSDHSVADNAGVIVNNKGEMKGKQHFACVNELDL